MYILKSAGHDFQGANVRYCAVATTLSFAGIFELAKDDGL